MKFGAKESYDPGDFVRVRGLPGTGGRFGGTARVVKERVMPTLGKVGYEVEFLTGGGIMFVPAANLAPTKPV